MARSIEKMSRRKGRFESALLGANDTYRQRHDYNIKVKARRQGRR